MGSVLHGLKGFLGFAEGEDAVNDWAEAGLLDRAIHLLEVPAGADIDAADIEHFVQDGRDAEGLFPAGEHADLGDDAAGAGSGHGLLKSAGAADFHSDVDAAAIGLADRPMGPFGIVAVVETGIEAKFGGAAELVCAGGGAEDARTQVLSKLQRKTGDAASALNEDSVAGLDVGGGDDGIPSGNAGTGEGGSLFKAEVRGELYDTVLIEQDLLSESAVDITAEGAFEFLRGGFAVEPALEEGAAHLIADRDFRYSFANSGDDSRTVGAGNAVGLELRIVGALDRHEVAEVERDGVNVEEDLSGTWLRCGDFIEGELIDTECGDAPSFHGAIRTGNRNGNSRSLGSG
jgi:hypothetical protein